MLPVVGAVRDSLALKPLIRGIPAVRSRRDPGGADPSNSARPRRTSPPNTWPGRAIRGMMLRSRSHAKLPAEWYALSARTLSGCRRRGPRRERTAGIPRTSGRSAWTSLTFAADAPTATGSPCASVRTGSLLPALPRLTGFGPVSGPPFRAHRGSIDDHRAPVESAAGSDLVQNHAVQPTPHSGCGPEGKPPVSRRRRHSERRWQIPPRAPAGQHVHDGREHGTLVGRRGATALRARAEGRQYRLDHCP